MCPTMYICWDDRNEKINEWIVYFIFLVHNHEDQNQQAQQLNIEYLSNVSEHQFVILNRYLTDTLYHPAFESFFM